MNFLKTTLSVTFALSAIACGSSSSDNKPKAADSDGFCTQEFINFVNQSVQTNNTAEINTDDVYNMTCSELSRLNNHTNNIVQRYGPSFTCTGLRGNEEAEITGREYQEAYTGTQAVMKEKCQ